MPQSNYYTIELNAFITKEAKREPHTPSKKTSVMVDGKQCKKFSEDHFVEDGLVYRAVGGTEIKQTLANDNPLNHELAKLTLIRKGGDDFDEFKSLDDVTTYRGKKRAKALVNSELEALFDVGSKFIQDDKVPDLAWDFEELQTTAKAYDSVLGDENKTVETGSQQIVLAHHDEMLSVLLSRAVDKSDLAHAQTFLQDLAKHQEELTAEVNQVVQSQLDEHGRLLDEHGRLLVELHDEVEMLKSRMTRVELQQASGSGSADAQADAKADTKADAKADTQADANADTKAGTHVDTNDADLMATALTTADRKNFQDGLKKPATAYVRKPFIKGKDLKTLKKKTWLNDIIINNFLDLVARDNGRKVRCDLFNSYFLPVLCRGGKLNYDNVKNWGTNLCDDIFSDLDYLFIPINKEQSHWALLVVDMNAQEVKAYDSLEKSCRKELKAVHEYLKAEHEIEEGL